MSAGFQSPITIKDAIDNIFHNNYLLPAIQRKFTWSSSQIELLFDSIMRDYPINSFMFWKVSDSNIKQNYKFYQFLNSYREFFQENNPDANTHGIEDFYAVIDGQQRLTSLYIGLKGSYAYKMPRLWWIDNEENIPTRHLYLDLQNPADECLEGKKRFNFLFLKNSEVESKKNFWFKVENILTIDSLPKINSFLHKNNLIDNEFAVNTLTTLYEKIHKDKLINYYLEDDQESDKVLEIFIRTNSGGTSLSFSDLLMSISSANWKKLDAREEMENLTKEVFNIGNAKFIISKDFILKTCLCLFSDDIKFQLKNFHSKNIKKFEDNWQSIRTAIVSTFSLLEQLRFNDTTFRAKNAAIPIIYYVYHNDLSQKILKQTYSKTDKANIAKWLNISFLKSIFSGHSDAVLLNIRGVLKKSGAAFPIKEIIDKFKNDPAKNYTFGEKFIEGLLNSQYGKNETFYILALLTPNTSFVNQSYHVDHMHPQVFFENKKEVQKIFPKTEDFNFAIDKDNWNSLPNLQLLTQEENCAKQGSALIKWVEENKISKKTLLVDDSIDLSISNFKNFIENRKKHLRKKIKQILEVVEIE